MTRDVDSIPQLPLLTGVAMLIWISIWGRWFICIGRGGSQESCQKTCITRGRKCRVQADELFFCACGHSVRQWDVDLQACAIKLSSPGSLYNCNYIYSERTSQIPVFQQLTSIDCRWFKVRHMRLLRPFNICSPSWEQNWVTRPQKNVIKLQF